MKKILTIVALASAWSMQAQVPYRVISPMHGLAEGTTVYLTNYDTGEPVDSVCVNEGAAVFTGDIDEPIAVRMTANGNRYGTFILEQGTTAINEKSRMASGTMLNDKYNALMNSLVEKAEMIDQLSDGVQAEQQYAAFLSEMASQIADNDDSPVGYLMFIDYAQMAEPDDVKALVAQHPSLADYQRVQNMLSQLAIKEATSVGKPFVDFAITHDGVTKRLSDHVGKGHPVLVDFWASWCGPCIREIPNIKEVYAKYKDQGLEVLGVAVWDEPADTKAAIDRLQIPWECFIDAQTIPTDAYGISGIPCIILFGPDGTILGRDLRGAQIDAAVAAALAK